jgi:uncharacterized membrane protein
MSRAAKKVITYRLLVTSCTILAILVYTEDWALAGGLGAVDTLGKSALYYLHERLWA